MITKRNLSELIERNPRSGSPTLSVYLDTDQSVAANLNRKFEVALFNGLREVEEKLDSREQLDFLEDSIRVQEFVEGYRPRAEGLVIFSDASEKFFWAHEIHVAVGDRKDLFSTQGTTQTELSLRRAFGAKSPHFLFEPTAAVLAIVELTRLLSRIYSYLLTVRAFLLQTVSHRVNDYLCPDGIHFGSPSGTSFSIARFLGFHTDSSKMSVYLMIHRVHSNPYNEPYREDS